MSSIQLSGLASGIDTESIVKELMSAESIKKENLEKDLQMLEWEKEAWEEVNTKIYEFYTKDLYEMKQQSTYMTKNATADTSIVDATASVNAVSGVHSIKVNKLATGSYLTSSEVTVNDGTGTTDITNSTTMDQLVDFGGAPSLSIEITSNGTDYVTVDINSTDTLNTFSDNVEQALEDAGYPEINVSFDDNFNRFFLSSKDTGTNQQIVIKAPVATSNEEKLLNALGFTDGDDTVDDVVDGFIVGSVGVEAEFDYNGTSLTSSDNTVTINGIDISLLSTGTTNIVVEDDTDAVYDKIKNFINSYNELTTYLNEKVYAEYNKDYEPLTDEEKETMTDDEIKLWEDTIKKSLLRRDDILTSSVSYMRNTLTTGYDSSTYKYESLSALGIVTGDYSERGLLHIEGDDDDPIYSSRQNALKEALENDPEEVAELFAKIIGDMYTELTDRMASSSISSAFTIYNDKILDNDIIDQKEAIDDMEDYLITIEDRYYSQFTAMEQMIMQLNNQSSSLVSMLGGN